MERAAQHHLIRTVVSLCELAATATDRRIRDDLADEAVMALDIASADEQLHDGALQKWAGSLTALLNRLEHTSALDHEALAYANVRLLRLQSSLTVGTEKEKPKPVGEQVPAIVRARSVNAATRRRPLGENQQRVLEWLRGNPGKRTHELIAHFAGTLSGRTIKRSLKDMVTANLLRRTEQDGAVAYEPLDGAASSAI